MNKFATMKIGDDVDFYALVESSQKRYTPNKSAYYGITSVSYTHLIETEKT